MCLTKQANSSALLRKVALKLVRMGEKQVGVADLMGVSRQTISKWVKKEKI